MLAFFVLVAVFALAVAGPQAGATDDSTLEGLQKATNEGFEANVGEEGGEAGVITDIPTALGQVIGAVLAFTGTLFFVLMIYGGLLWMLARGNEQQVEKAKNLITAAIIGLIIILGAYALTAYIGGALTDTGNAGSTTL